MILRDMDKTLKPDADIAIPEIMRRLKAKEIDKLEAIKEFRKAMGAGEMGSALPSDEEVFASAEELIEGWDQKDISGGKD